MVESDVDVGECLSVCPFVCHMLIAVDWYEVIHDLSFLMTFNDVQIWYDDKLDSGNEVHQVWQCEELLDVWQRDLANKCRTWKRECSMLDEHDQVDVWFTLKERKKNAEMGSEPVSLVIKKGWLKWFGYVEQQWKWKEVNQGDI